MDREKWGANCNTYDSPPTYYYDIEFDCVDCGSKEVWKATQQKWWYEEVAGDINASAVRCRRCRARIQAEKEEQKRHMQEKRKERKEGI